MPIPLPNLDDRTYADLVEEARALIPGYGPGWTDHNPSDPGTTLLELFAFLAEGLIYRADQIPDATRLVFLTLLRGSEAPELDLPVEPRARAAAVDAALTAALVDLRTRFRAVTSEDYEELAREASPLVARAHCVPRRDLDADPEADRPGELTVVIVPSTDLAPADARSLAQDVWTYLDERRILTTRHHVTTPVDAPIAVDVLLQRRADVRDEDVRTALADALSAFLDPRKGGEDRSGWPFGRSVYVSELVGVLERVAEIDHVASLRLASECPPHADDCVPGVEEWHENGDLVGIALGPHQLPQFVPPAAGDVVVGTAFVPVTVDVAATAIPGADHLAIARAVKEIVRTFFDPRSGGPTGTGPWPHPTPRDELLQLLQTDLPADVDAVTALTVTADTAHTYRTSAGAPDIEIFAGELVEVQTTVTVS